MKMELVESTPWNPTTAVNKNHSLAQYSADARLLSEYELSVGSGKSFNYSTLLTHAPKAIAEQEMAAYLVLLGRDDKNPFLVSSTGSLERAVASREISLLNPIWVHSRTTRKPFYAILHRIDVGVMIDLEPANSSDPTLLLAGAVHSQKLVVRAISRLQSLPGGISGAMCDTIVEEVQKLTGYDRVMVYKFHDDDHGEVVYRKLELNIVAIVTQESVPVIRSQELKQLLCLVNSTLRAPHGCHAVYMANISSVASLVMHSLINNMCHESYGSMGLQLYMELQLAEQKAEKRILRMQTTLCDMLVTLAQDDEDNGGGKMMKYGQQTDSGAKEIDEISSVACEMLTGVIASEAMGKSLIDEVVHETSRVVVEDLVYRALQELSMANVMSELILALWSHLRPAPYPWGGKLLQLLRKLGSRNRRLWDHLRSNVDLYTQSKESRPDEVAKQKPKESRPDELANQKPKESFLNLHNESERIKWDKFSKSRRSKDWKSTIRDPDEPPPLRNAVIANIHAYDISYMRRSPSPQRVIQIKRDRGAEGGQIYERRQPDERSQLKKSRLYVLDDARVACT
ncbi:phytochrome E [Tanacetum coccineum]